MNKDKHIQFATIAQVNAAFSYLTEPKKIRRTNSFICLGRNSATRTFLRQIKMPALPLLADNVDLRKSLEPREKSPLFRVVASAIALKAEGLKKEISAAIKDENSKPESPEILYRLEPPKNGEFIDKNPLTGEQFNALLTNEKEANPKPS